MLRLDKEYTLSIPWKAADTPIGDIDCNLSQKNYKEPLLYVTALSQLRPNILGRMYPIYLTDDAERMTGSNGLIYKPRK